MMNFPYLTALVMFICGLFVIITSDNNLKKLIGLSVFQSSILFFYVAMAKVEGGLIPIDQCGNNHQSSSYCVDLVYSSPLPHVLMLTGIVVGFATLAFGLSLIRQMQVNFQTVVESGILDIINNDIDQQNAQYID